MLCISLAFGNNVNVIAGMVLPGGIYVFPLTFLICDIISEAYGYALAKAFIWYGFIAQGMFVLLAQLFLLMPTSDAAGDGSAYHAVFDPTIRLSLAALAGFYVGERFNIYLMNNWRIRLSGKYFILRSICSTAIGQAFLSIIVDAIGFYDKLSHAELLHMMISTWSLKVIYSLIFVFPTMVLMKHLKKSEAMKIREA